MITDLDTPQEMGEVSCDVCIVGAGAAGLAIATELLNTRLRVVIVESGGMELEPATQSLYDVDISGLPLAGATQGRFRVCGGSTTQWAGQALPLMPSDFERREWIAYSGWPIGFDDLLPFYERASRFLMIDSRGFDGDLFQYLRAQPSIFDPQKLWYHFSKWSPRPNLRETYLAGIRTSRLCTLMLHANVTHIVMQDSLNLVRTVTARSLSGRRMTVNARAVVLCVGGIETARLFLANDSQLKNGIGNEHGLVGRFFQDHPYAIVGWVKSGTPALVQRLFNVFRKRGLKYSVRCTAAFPWQRAHQTLNTSMGINFVEDALVFQELTEIYASFRAGKISKRAFRQLLHAVTRPSQAMAPVWQYLVHGRSFSPGARLRVELTCEQEPDPESRILLSDKTDALGTPLANIRWKVSDLTWHTMQLFADSLRKEFLRTGLGEIHLESWIDDHSSDWRGHISDQYHHMGTTRMSDSPRLGVVDRDCRVHGIPNLYIGSSSTFPTSGHSNPTLTIIALCMRLADRIKLSLT